MRVSAPDVQQDYMRLALCEALAGVNAGHGGPFGAVIVCDGKVVACAHNTVVRDHDPTAHGEINAIRAAGAALGRFDLSDCELYTTAEPCPMCHAAIIWARIPKVYFACTIADTAALGFADLTIRAALTGTAPDPVSRTMLLREECLSAFDAWLARAERIAY